MFKWFKQKKRKTYVIIYDNEDDSEEYYGYFSSRQEALAIFTEFSHGTKVTNVKLCLIIEDLSLELSEFGPYPVLGEGDTYTSKFAGTIFKRQNHKWHLENTTSSPQ